MSKQSELFDAACIVRKNAHAPYSEFLVGAAILDKSGRIHVGCNVENVAYPEGTCAEAGAIAAMCAAGGNREIEAVLVVTGNTRPSSPCGGCRQKIAEFGSFEVPVMLANLNGVQETVNLAQILPGAFSPDDLKNTGETE